MNSTKLAIRDYVIYGKEDEVITPHFVHCTQIDKNHVGKLNGRVKPHLHSHLFQVILIESGTTLFKSEYDEFKITKPCIITIPENTLHEFVEEPDLKGRVITFSTKLLEELMAFNSADLIKLDSILVLENIPAEKKAIFSISESIEKELLETSKEKDMAIRAWLSLLLVNLLRIVSANKKGIVNLSRSSHQYFNSFQKSIKQSGNANKPLKVYARELGITTTHLNRICKKIVGKSASKVVQGYILLEAKRQLKYSNQTVSEISYLLNFSHPAYFSRFFKKHTNFSPKAYRASKVEMLVEEN